MPNDLLRVDNHGPLVTATNFWDTDLARNGKVFASVNAGAIRVLLPPQLYPLIAEMRTGRECVLSRGPWPEAGHADAVEIMWDDGSRSPFALHLTPESFDLLPAEPEPGREWTCTVWTAKDGRPHKALERRCHWRRVERLPWLKPWGGGGVPGV